MDGIVYSFFVVKNILILFHFAQSVKVEKQNYFIHNRLRKLTTHTYYNKVIKFKSNFLSMATLSCTFRGHFFNMC